MAQLSRTALRLDTSAEIFCVVIKLAFVKTRDRDTLTK